MLLLLGREDGHAIAVAVVSESFGLGTTWLPLLLPLSLGLLLSLLLSLLLFSIVLEHKQASIATTHAEANRLFINRFTCTCTENASKCKGQERADGQRTSHRKKYRRGQRRLHECVYMRLENSCGGRHALLRAARPILSQWRLTERTITSKTSHVWVSSTNHNCTPEGIIVVSSMFYVRKTADLLSVYGSAGGREGVACSRRNESRAGCS